MIRVENKPVSDFILYSQIPMAVSGLALLTFYSQIFNHRMGPFDEVLAFLGIWLVYLLDGVGSSHQEDLLSQKLKAIYFHKHTKLIRFAICLILILAFLIFVQRQFNFKDIVFLLIVGGSGLLYSPPWGKFRLKNLVPEKTLFVSFIWTIASVLGPLALGSSVLGSVENISVSLFSCHVLAHVFLLFPLMYLDTSLLDLRDIEADKTFGIQSFWSMSVWVKKLIFYVCFFSFILGVYLLWLAGELNFIPVYVCIFVYLVLLKSKISDILQRAGLISVLLGLWRFLPVLYLLIYTY